MSTAHHLPPSALDDWVIRASTELGLAPDTAATKTLLNLARDVAHDVARPAAPVSTFLLGLAVGRAEDPDEALTTYSARLVELARTWAAEREGEPGAGSSGGEG